MTLEELMQAMKDAKAKAEANPEDKKLQAEAAQAEKAYNDAKAEADRKAAGQQDGGEGEANGEDEDFDESKSDTKTKAYIAKLRAENAKHRTAKKSLADQLKLSEAQKKAMLKAAGVEVEDDKPEEQIKSLSTKNSTLEFRTAILESAMDHGIPRDQVDYYEFLVTKATNSLEEGEELTDEAVAEIVKKVKAATGKGAANTTVGTKGKGGQEPPNPGASGEVSLGKFISMSMREKSTLYSEKPAVYEALMKEARSKKKLV